MPGRDVHAEVPAVPSAKPRLLLIDGQPVPAEGLEWLGRFSEYLIRDGYRMQLRFFPWMYGLLYTLVTRVAPVRVVGLRCLSLISARRMLRRISTAFLTWVGASDIAFSTVSWLPTTLYPSNWLPGSIPTTSGWFSGSCA